MKLEEREREREGAAAEQPCEEDDDAERDLGPGREGARGRMSRRRQRTIER